jgi:hypothetical protein
MQRTLNYPTLSATELDGAPIFNVVIAYEDFETGKAAKETYDFLAEKLGHDCQFNNQMWKFDVLSIPNLREMAVRDAAAAEIVMISCHGNSEFPKEVKSWLERWLAAQTRAIALVGLFDARCGDPGQARSNRAYLADAARRARVEFFAQPGQPLLPALNETPLTFNRVASAAGNVSLSQLSGVIKQDTSFPRWGINE